VDICNLNSLLCEGKELLAYTATFSVVRNETTRR
jgi:hypothetical protein